MVFRAAQELRGNNTNGDTMTTDAQNTDDGDLGERLDNHEKFIQGEFLRDRQRLLWGAAAVTAAGVAPVVAAGAVEVSERALVLYAVSVVLLAVEGWLLWR